MISDPSSAAHALMVLAAADMFDADRTSLAPALDARLAPEWELVAHLVGRDALFRAGPLALGESVYYGCLLRSRLASAQYALVIRGTGSLLEWIEDAEFLGLPHPAGVGCVEAGFFGVYASLALREYGAPVAQRAADYLTRALPQLCTLSVIGHSLGAALATYLTFELAASLGDRVSGCFLASPHPGDAAFAAAFAERVQHYRLINYTLDVVPHVPFGPGYAHLPGVTWIAPKDAQARIGFDLACHHHVTSYAAMLDWNAADWAGEPARDAPLLACIRGASR